MMTRLRNASFFFLSFFFVPHWNSRKRSYCCCLLRVVGSIRPIDPRCWRKWFFFLWPHKQINRCFWRQGPFLVWNLQMPKRRRRSFVRSFFSSVSFPSSRRLMLEEEMEKVPFWPQCLGGWTRFYTIIVSIHVSLIYKTQNNLFILLSFSYLHKFRDTEKSPAWFFLLLLIQVRRKHGGN